MASFAGMSMILSVAVLSMTTACSRRVTCALEGCTKNGSVVLSSDFQSEEKAAQDADAVAADTSAIEKEIADIKARMELNDSMAKLLDETVKSHEKRIAALEENSEAFKAALADLDGRMLSAEESLELVSEQIAELELQINGGEGDQGLVDQLAKLKDRQNAMRQTIQRLKNRVQRLEEFRADQKEWNRQFREKLQKLTEKVRNLKDLIKEVKSDLLDVINDEIGNLSSQLGSVNTAIDSLQTRVDQIEITMVTQDEYQADLDQQQENQADVEEALAALDLRIDDVSIAANASECEVSAKYREGLLWFRDLTCDGVKLKILVL